MVACGRLRTGAMAKRKLSRKLQRHTHAQYVALRNNEDRLLSDRFIALIFASSFLAVVWATGDQIGIWGRLSVASIGLLVTLGMWWVTLRAARAGEDWRRLAILEEQWIYGPYIPNAKLSMGPYGLRQVEDQASGRSVLKRSLYKLLFLFGMLDKLGLGRTNIVSAFWIPLFLAAWWTFAIVYTCCVHDWPPLDANASD